MTGYCNHCENNCPSEAPRCGRGYRMQESEGGFSGREFDAFGGRPAFGFDGGPRGFRDGDGMPPRGGRPPHGMPPHGRPPFGGGRPPFGGGRPPFDGRPPRPEPSGEMLRARIGEAGLAELIELAGRMLHHRPGAGGARGQNLILSILAGREALSQRELQQMLGVQPGSMSEIVTKLEKKGLVTREKGEDRRGNLLRLTEEGRQAIPDPSAEPDDALFEALTAEQQDALARLLRTLLNDWAGRIGVRE